MQRSADLKIEKETFPLENNAFHKHSFKTVILKILGRKFALQYHRI